MHNIKAFQFFIILFLLIGCATSGQVTDIGISPLGMSDADPNMYSIIVGRFPQMSFPGTYMRSGWSIRIKGSDSANSLLYKGMRGFSGNEIYSINSWDDEAFYAFLIPEGTYEIRYYFPTGTGATTKSEVVYTKELSVIVGQVIYIGSHQPNILEEQSGGYNNTVTTSTYQGMDILDNSEEDFRSLEKKYPKIFSGDKFKAINLTI